MTFLTVFPYPSSILRDFYVLHDVQVKENSVCVHAEYPWLDPEYGQQFPFRTFSMLISVFCILFFSLLTRWLFLSHILPLSWDVWGVFKPHKPALSGNDQAGGGVVNAGYTKDAPDKTYVDGIASKESYETRL
jgi:hypothetical protein